MKRICVLPGDGIGPEVVDCAVAVLKEATNDLRFEYAEIGESAMKSVGNSLPGATIDLMRKCDSTLFGAVTSSESLGGASPVLQFRKELDLYANLRPVRNYVRLAGRPQIDVVIVRENTEGMYTQNEQFDDKGVTTLRRVTRTASERIVKFAIEYALRNGRKSICCVHKANVLRASDGLFVSIFRELMATQGRDLVTQEQLVDSAAMKLVNSPHEFDVLVTLNLYGDILSDVAAGTAGGLGFAPSGNIGLARSVFEPAHGSAPDIAGKDTANPTATILAGAMMLDHLQMPKEAESIRRAVKSTYDSGHLTIDLGGRHGSKSFTNHVIERLSRTPT